jgi:SAM-dependent methyltransferase
MAPAYELLASSERITKDVDALEPHLRGIGAQRLLDAGCAAGFHSLELARRGFDVVWIDRVEAMIREARRRAPEAGRNRADRSRDGRPEGPAAPSKLDGNGSVAFHVHDLRTAQEAPGAPFDALLCLGNTISSVGVATDRARTLRAFRDALRPGGLLILQMRDLSTIRKSGHTFPVRALRRGDEEWILLRRHDPLPGKMRFLSFLLYRGGPGSAWELEAGESVAAITPPGVWRDAVAAAGFARVRAVADLAGTPRRGKGTGDLVIFARRG